MKSPLAPAVFGTWCPVHEPGGPRILGSQNHSCCHEGCPGADRAPRGLCVGACGCDLPSPRGSAGQACASPTGSFGIRELHTPLPQEAGHGGCLIHNRQLLSVISGLSCSAHSLPGAQEGLGSAGGFQLLQHLLLPGAFGDRAARECLCSGSSPSSLLRSRDRVLTTAFLTIGVRQSSLRCLESANLICCFIRCCECFISTEDEGFLLCPALAAGSPLGRTGLRQRLR